jgi:hypothetical protein
VRVDPLTIVGVIGGECGHAHRRPPDGTAHSAWSVGRTSRSVMQGVDARGETTVGAFEPVTPGSSTRRCAYPRAR